MTIERKTKVKTMTISTPHTPTHSHTGFIQRLASRLFSAEVSRRTQLAVAALDDARDALHGSGRRERDRFTADREEILRDALLAWRTNPLANVSSA